MTDAEPMNAAAKLDDSDGSASDSDSSDADAFELSEQDMASMQTLEEALKADPYNYDSHVKYIAVLRKGKLKERLKGARRAMQERFPLTEQLWTEWLDDESSASSPEKTTQLFQMAIGDYLSVPLWRKYLEFVRDHDDDLAAGTPASCDSFRQLYERALSAGGLHVAQGSQLWNVAREWEVSLLARDQEDVKQQQRVRALFHRQLQVPLADGAATLAACQAWETRLQPGAEVPKSVAQGHDKAQAAAALRAASEASVAPGKPADDTLLAAYAAYIRLEKGADDPARVQARKLGIRMQRIIYERALAAFALTSHLWLEYARYLEAKLHSATIAVPVYARAARNCPWVGVIWGRYLNALERQGVDDAEHAATYQRALGSGLQTMEDYMEVVLARLDAIRRRGADAMPQLRETFTAAGQTLQASHTAHETFGDVPDPLLRLPAYWADCEAHLAGDAAAARAVWEAVLKTAAGRSSEAWVAYISMERALRHIREARALYKRCYARKFADGSQPAMCHAWLRFEREEGSAEDHLQACLKVEPILTEVAAAAAAADAETAARAKEAVAKAPALSREEMQQLRQQKDPNFGKKGADGQQAAGKKRRQQEGKQQAQPGKRPRTDAAGPAAAGAAAPDHAVPMEADQAAPESGAAAAAPAAAEPGGATAAPPAAAQPGSPRDGGGASSPRGGHQPTAFVRNIHRDTTDEELQGVLAECGAIKGMRHVRHPAGTSKGFAFVDFMDQQSLTAAIAKSGTELRGQPLSILESQPPKGDRGRGRGGRGGGRSGERGHGRAAGRGDPHGRDGGHGRGRDGGQGRGRDGGRGRGRDDAQGPSGLGGGAGRAGWGGSAAGRQHQKMDVQASNKPGLGLFKPRAVAVGSEEHHPVRTNDEFRKMLLAKKKPPAAGEGGGGQSNDQ